MRKAGVGLETLARVSPLVRSSTSSRKSYKYVYQEFHIICIGLFL